MNAAIALLLLIALLAANLPWFSERLFYLVPLKHGKHLGWRALELVVLYFLTGAIAYLAETRTLGQAVAQHWEFYAITACLFLVFSVPGFVYSHLWRR
ncbi:MAG TPA: DUF2818 family protein [Novimethylophilus sp.]|jgi:hypothetical protein|uniref:DUF2818 family protein n=1 Tax=Novimethylophilus sp. TaxID=2137426 RepID=UPI002F40BBF6